MARLLRERNEDASAPADQETAEVTDSIEAQTPSVDGSIGASDEQTSQPDQDEGMPSPSVDARAGDAPPTAPDDGGVDPNGGGATDDATAGGEPRADEGNAEAPVSEDNAPDESRQPDGVGDIGPDGVGDAGPDGVSDAGQDGAGDTGQDGVSDVGQDGVGDIGQQGVIGDDEGGNSADVDEAGRSAGEDERISGDDTEPADATDDDLLDDDGPVDDGDEPEVAEALPDPAIEVTTELLREQERAARRVGRREARDIQRAADQSVSAIQTAERSQVATAIATQAGVSAALSAAAAVARGRWHIESLLRRNKFRLDAAQAENDLDAALAGARNTARNNRNTRQQGVTEHERGIIARLEQTRATTVAGARAFEARFRRNWARAKHRNAAYQIAFRLRGETERDVNRGVRRDTNKFRQSASRIRSDLFAADNESVAELGKGHEKIRHGLRDVVAQTGGFEQLNHSVVSQLESYRVQAATRAVGELGTFILSVRRGSAAAQQQVRTIAAGAVRQVGQATRKAARAIRRRRRDVERAASEPGSLPATELQRLVEDSQGLVARLGSIGNRIGRTVLGAGQRGAEELAGLRERIDAHRAWTIERFTVGANEVVDLGVDALGRIFDPSISQLRSFVDKTKGEYDKGVADADTEIAGEARTARGEMEKAAVDVLREHGKRLPRYKRVTNQQAVELYDKWYDKLPDALSAIKSFLVTLAKAIALALAILAAIVIAVVAVIAAIALLWALATAALAALGTSIAAVSFGTALTTGFAIAGKVALLVAAPMAVIGSGVAGYTFGTKVQDTANDPWKTRRERYEGYADASAEFAAEFIDPPIDRLVKPVRKLAGGRLRQAFNRVDSADHASRAWLMEKSADGLESLARRAEIRAGRSGSARATRRAERMRELAERARQRAAQSRVRADDFRRIADEPTAPRQLDEPTAPRDLEQPRALDEPTAPRDLEQPRAVDEPTAPRDLEQPRAVDDAATIEMRAPAQEPAPLADLVGKDVELDVLAQRMGIAPDDVRKFADYAAQRGVVIYIRPANPATPAGLASGGVPKPLEVKFKTVKDIDIEFLGFPAHTRGRPSVFKPRHPSESPKFEAIRTQDPARADAIMKRYESRLGAHNNSAAKLAEFQGMKYAENGKEMTVDIIRPAEDGTLRVFDPRTGAERTFAGDYDLFDIRMPDGSPLSYDHYVLVRQDLMHMGLAQHGAEMRMAQDVGADAFKKQRAGHLERVREHSAPQPGETGTREPLLQVGDGAPKAAWNPSGPPAKAAGGGPGATGGGGSTGPTGGGRGPGGGNSGGGANSGGGNGPDPSQTLPGGWHAPDRPPATTEATDPGAAARSAGVDTTPVEQTSSPGGMPWEGGPIRTQSDPLQLDAPISTNSSKAGSGGIEGSADDPAAGVFLTTAGGQPVAVKRYALRDANGDVDVEVIPNIRAEMAAAEAAHVAAPDMAPQVYGWVDDQAGYASWAMSQQPGRNPALGETDEFLGQMTQGTRDQIAETRGWIRPETGDQLQRFMDEMARRDWFAQQLEYLVDANGNVHVVDFAGWTHASDVPDGLTVDDLRRWHNESLSDELGRINSQLSVRTP